MKNLSLIYLVTTGLILSCNTQNELELNTLSNEAVFTIVDNQPVFKGGMPAFYKYVMNNLEYPTEAKLNNVEGKVFIEFIITKTGTVESARILKGIEKSCDKAALDIINNSPDWNPGSQKGVPVNVKMVLPVTFSLHPSANKNTLEIEQLKGVSLENVDKMPEYKGGIPTFYTYVLANLEYPQQARQDGIEGKVIVKFVVTKNGDIKDATVLKGIGAGCDKAALEIIINSKGWTPGEHENKPVDVQMALPITFKLN
ncbi:MAG: energy transducer TonB [Cyclobacteriaceae bacterium]|nr:energy transducer TonB [Cyclobacteriaceae bacterium]